MAAHAGPMHSFSIDVIVGRRFCRNSESAHATASLIFRRTRTRNSNHSMPVNQIGAVLVPLNYRLTADDFVYLINHSGSRMVCADRDYLGTIDRIREQLPKVDHFVALSCS